MEYDVLANWEINKLCNFRCKYCFNPDEIKQNPEFRGHELTKIIDGFNNLGPVFLIHMSGGEPFLHPDFVELCTGLTKKHCISIN
ncbi:Coenzyme PQQ synthesis protein E [uncultured archaeon]|nr:Coenzyme PQQ synthesis protein E [uncultured archaeon]